MVVLMTKRLHCDVCRRPRQWPRGLDISPSLGGNTPMNTMGGICFIILVELVGRRSLDVYNIAIFFHSRQGTSGSLPGPNT